MGKSKRSRFIVAAVGALCTLTLVVVACYRLGLPLTLYTWVVVTICGASGATLGLSGKRHLLPFAVAVAVCTYLAIPGPFQIIPGIEKGAIFDDVGSRSGWEITPGLQFGGDGPNTAILEYYVGPLEPKWRLRAPHSPYIRDGDERVQSRNIIRYEYFPTILALLPDDDARRAVIECLTDTENRLRVHQGLLLACLCALKHPAGMDRKSWWTHHKDLFYPEHDPFVAASLTQGWLENIEAIPRDADESIELASQIRAAHYQQKGSWGGHNDFGRAFMEIEWGQRKPDPSSIELARRIVWWPERRTQDAK